MGSQCLTGYGSGIISMSALQLTCLESQKIFASLEITCLQIPVGRSYRILQRCVTLLMESMAQVIAYEVIKGFLCCDSCVYLSQINELVPCFLPSPVISDQP